MPRLAVCVSGPHPNTFALLKSRMTVGTEIADSNPTVVFKLWSRLEKNAQQNATANGKV